MLNNKTYGIIVLAFILMAACTDRDSNNSSVNSDELKEDIITLTTTQLAASEIEVAAISHRLLQERIEVYGSLETNPGNVAMVAPVMKGYLKSFHVQTGKYVRKGEALATLSHPDYIRLQEDYLETLSQYEYYKEDFKRQGELSIDQAISIRKMQEAQNEFRKTEARLFSLKHQLKFLGLDPESIHVESMLSDIDLLSPITGYVSAIEAKIGMLCPEEKPVFRITGTGNYLLHLQLFGKNAGKISPGQNIAFSLVNNPEIKYSAKLVSSSHEIDDQNILHVHAVISEESNNFLPGMHVKAEISIKSDSVYALPETGIIYEGDAAYIFEQTADLQFRSIEVETGRTDGPWVELISFPEELLNAKIVVEGAYELHAAINQE